jgi:hypothetical protein
MICKKLNIEIDTARVIITHCRCSHFKLDKNLGTTIRVCFSCNNLK